MQAYRRFEELLVEVGANGHCLLVYANGQWFVLREHGECFAQCSKHVLYGKGLGGRFRRGGRCVVFHGSEVLGFQRDAMVALRCALASGGCRATGATDHKMAYASLALMSLKPPFGCCMLLSTHMQETLEVGACQINSIYWASGY